MVSVYLSRRDASIHVQLDLLRSLRDLDLIFSTWWPDLSLRDLYLKILPLEVAEVLHFSQKLNTPKQNNYSPPIPNSGSRLNPRPAGGGGGGAETAPPVCFLA